ncbi:hypothetical protein EYF80_017587 [Liparis tanakae]|uniref:Uncharacterized protein n=1 Tax=Liparis tanakae TaxID=230148 RepID=A0A4Z2I249_9TELE|nr:hypothetical protein EYF80_017587 [Liparis tanakae]
MSTELHHKRPAAVAVGVASGKEERGLTKGSLIHRGGERKGEHQSMGCHSMGPMPRQPPLLAVNRAIGEPVPVPPPSPCAFLTADAAQGNKRREGPTGPTAVARGQQTLQWVDYSPAHSHTETHTQSALQRQLSTSAFHYCCLWPLSHNTAPES